MLDCLAQPPTYQNVGPVQSGAMMALIDSYDRKVEREFFCGIAALSLSLHSAMGRLHTVNTLKEIAKDPQFMADPARAFDEALKSLESHAAQRHKELNQMAHLLVQCPTEADTIS